MLGLDISEKNLNKALICDLKFGVLEIQPGNMWAGLVVLGTAID
jgi:hypothetical protein